MSRQTIIAASQSPVDAIALDLRCADLIGCRPLNIYGYQQQDIEDQLEDESSWWLEFEHGVWMTVEQVIAPAFISPTFQLHCRFYYAEQFPLRDSTPFAKNPPQLAPLLGLQLLELMESVYDDALLSVEALRLGFGDDGRITAELHIGYLDEAPRRATFPGMAARALLLETARNIEPTANNTDRLLHYFQTIADAKRQIKNTGQRAFRQSRWATPFYVARKITGVLLIALGLVLLWEMATMLSSSDITRKVLFGFGGGALMLIISGVLCLIAKRGEDALE